MGWVRRAEPAPVHECAVPMAIKDLTIEQADGEHGDVWRCDDCRTPWVLFVNSWQTAGWRLRIRHWRDGYPPKQPYDVRGLASIDVAPPLASSRTVEMPEDFRD